MPVSRVYLYLGATMLLVALGFGLDYYLTPSARVTARIIRPPLFKSESAAERQISRARSSIGGPFTLIDQNGNTVKDTDFRGRHMLIFFGYTYCPDICPTNLSTMSKALDLLGKAGEKVQPIFVTVDPARDTPAQMKMYVEHFNKRFLGLTGSPEQVKKAALAYGVFTKKTDEDPQDGENYLMAHTATTFMMGPDGQLEAFFRNGASADSVALKIKQFLK